MAGSLLELLFYLILVGVYFNFFRFIIGFDLHSCIVPTIALVGFSLAAIKNIAFFKNIEGKTKKYIKNKDIVTRQKRRAKKTSLSLKELNQHNIISGINCQYQGEHINKEALYAAFAEYHLIKTHKLKGTASIYLTFDFPTFFGGLKKHGLLNRLLLEFSDRLKQEKIKGIGILSKDKADWNRLFSKSWIENEQHIRNALKETIWKDGIMVLQKDHFEKLTTDDAIVLVQLMDEGENFLKSACDYLSKSDFKIVRIITFFSQLKEPLELDTGVKEEIIVGLNLNEL